jgi:hypothetical protein
LNPTLQRKRAAQRQLFFLSHPNAPSAWRWKPALPKTRDTEQGPPRREGVVPLPRSERGGSRAAAQGVIYTCAPESLTTLLHLADSALI